METVVSTESAPSVETSAETISASDIALFKSGGASSGAKPTGEVAATPAAEKTQERDDSGKFKSKEPAAEAKAEVKPESKPEAKPAEVKPAEKQEPKPTGQLAALMAERAKRQELERRLAALESGKAETPDIFTEPEKAVQALVAKQVAPIKSEFFLMSLENAQSKHADFEAAMENFVKVMDANPALENQLREERNPGEFIYLVGSNTPEFRQARDSKHREEVSAKDTEITALKAELETLKAAAKARSEVPESLNRQPSGAVPERDGDEMDIRKIVRFKPS